MTVIERLTSAANSLQAVARRVRGPDSIELREISTMLRGALATMKRDAEAQAAKAAGGMVTK